MPFLHYQLAINAIWANDYIPKQTTSLLLKSIDTDLFIQIHINLNLCPTYTNYSQILYIHHNVSKLSYTLTCICTVNRLKEW